MTGRLCITRNRHQWVRVGGDVWIQVESARDGRARLVFVAPREIEIQRAERLDVDPPERIPPLPRIPVTHGWDDAAIGDR